ncbi:MAG: ATP-dependent RNA helicase [Elusimicrobia bacterium RIFOXYB2_FULL_49_7]|nr:MAG: ATP-dependent RNA helicase [Elusimicrobia bacterium RIFOXYB2_FULL_49_7]
MPHTVPAPAKTVSFNDLDLSKQVLQALTDVGYETPTPIQAQTIPVLLSGKDVIGQAQTGTGKTAAFALPFLSRLDIKQKKPQVLVLTPTRELTIQVAEAFQKYAAHVPHFHVLPIYGGQSYEIQLRQLNRAVHVVVGTPGRVIDHIKRKTLDLSSVKHMVLDEADEMLRMGFIDDVEWILKQTPPERQTALFSATMPPEIRRIAGRYMKEPKEIASKGKTQTADNIRHRYWLVQHLNKLDGLTRILEAETFDAILIFVRTKTATLEIAERLQARGYAAAPLNGEIPQKQRERTVDQLKKGTLDIIVATDVAARGLDVKRISHVVNYDIPYDTEGYIHRVGRTGRAGASGQAILFVSPRERGILNSIERFTRQKIEIMELPSADFINNKRITAFKQRMTDTLSTESLEEFKEVVTKYQEEHGIEPLDIAAALAKMVQGKKPFLLKHKPEGFGRSCESDRSSFPTRSGKKERGPRPAAAGRPNDEKALSTFRLQVGHVHGVKARNIVGAISNETGLDSRYIGHIDIQKDFTLVDLPTEMEEALLTRLKKTQIYGRALHATVEK